RILYPMVSKRPFTSHFSLLTISRRYILLRPLKRSNRKSSKRFLCSDAVANSSILVPTLKILTTKKKRGESCTQALLYCGSRNDLIQVNPDHRVKEVISVDCICISDRIGCVRGHLRMQLNRKSGRKIPGRVPARKPVGIEAQIFV